MPSASSFTNKVRAGSESRNTKIQYDGGIAQSPNPLGGLNCISTPNWWVGTQYKEIPKSCSPSKVVLITNLLATVDNTLGKINITWGLKLPDCLSIKPDCIVRFYRSDNTLVETASFPSGGLRAYSSTVLTSGYFYYVNVVLGDITTQSNTVQLKHSNDLTLYISNVSNICTLTFTASYPTRLRIQYFRNTVNSIYGGTLIDTFTVDSTLGFHTYTAMTAGYWYATIQPVGIGVFATSDPIILPSIPTATSLVYNSGTLTLNYTMNVSSPVTIYYYRSVTLTGIKTLIGSNSLIVSSGSNTNTFSIVPNSYYYHAIVSGIGNSSSTYILNAQFISIPTATSLVYNNSGILTLNYSIDVSSPVTIDYYKSVTPTGTQTQLGQSTGTAYLGSNTDNFSITPDPLNPVYYHATVRGYVNSSSIDAYQLVNFFKDTATSIGIQYYTPTSRSVTISYYSGSTFLQTNTLNAVAGINSDFITVVDGSTYYAVLSSAGFSITTPTITSTTGINTVEATNLFNNAVYATAPLIGPTGNVCFTESYDSGFGRGGKAFVFNSALTQLYATMAMNITYTTLASPVCIAPDNSIYIITTTNVIAKIASNYTTTPSWCAPSVASGDLNFYAIAASASYIYATSNKGIYKIDTTTTPPNNPPLYTAVKDAIYISVGSDGNVYVQSPTTIYALNSSLSLIWSYTITSTTGMFAISSTGTVYCNSSDNNKINAITRDGTSANGTALWSYSIGTATNNILLGSDGTVYASGGNTLYAFNSSGTVIWSYSPPQLSTITPIGIYASGGIVYAIITPSGQKKNALYAFTNGFVTKTYSIVDGYKYATVGSDGKVYAVTQNVTPAATLTKLYALTELV